ncbi:uncharacterized [Tachysurus ichikawai]
MVPLSKQVRLVSQLSTNDHAFVWCFPLPPLPPPPSIFVLWPICTYFSVHLFLFIVPSVMGQEMQSGVPGRPGRLGCHGCAMTPGRGNQMEALLWISFANVTHGQSALPAPTPILPQASLESSIFSTARFLCHPSFSF